MTLIARPPPEPGLLPRRRALGRGAPGLEPRRRPAARPPSSFRELRRRQATPSRFARANGLRVAAQGTGHGAAALGDLSDAVLVRTHQLRDVEIDAEARRARAGAGVIWEEVVEPATALGLTALHGSSPDVGVAGYTLGGGIGWLARKHGLAANSVTAIELVTADGEFHRADHDARARPLLGPARRRRQLRRRHGDRVRALPARAGLRRLADLAVGASRERVLARLARLDRDDARRGHLGRPHPAAARRSSRSRSRCAAATWSSSRSPTWATRRAAASCVAPLLELEPEMATLATMPGRRPRAPARRPRGQRRPGSATAACSTRCPTRRSTRLVAAAGPGSGSPFIWRAPPARRRARTPARAAARSPTSTPASSTSASGSRPSPRRPRRPVRRAALAEGGARPRQPRPAVPRTSPSARRRRTPSTGATPSRRLRELKMQVNPTTSSRRPRRSSDLSR